MKGAQLAAETRYISITNGFPAGLVSQQCPKLKGSPPKGNYILRAERAAESVHDDTGRDIDLVHYDIARPFLDQKITCFA